VRGRPLWGYNFTVESWNNCEGTQRYPDGNTYLGEYKDGYYNGQGTLTSHYGDKYVGGWKNHKRHEQGTYIYADGRVEEGMFKKGKFQYTQKSSPTLTVKKSPASPATPVPVKTATQATNKHALAVIIANKKYTDRTPSVDFAHNDADAMNAFVLNSLGYREGNIIDLRDATKAQIEATFGTKDTHKGKLYNYVRPGKSDVTVFYSGHGVPGLKDKRGYLLPVDADPNLVGITGYPVDVLYANLAKIDAKSITVYLDACFSGDSPKGMIVRATSGISITAKLTKTNTKLTVLTAAQGDQFASWDEDAKMGLFTKNLLSALNGAADKDDYGNGDGKVSVAEVQKYLDDEMSYQARRRWSREQQATVMGNPATVLSTVVQ